MIKTHESTDCVSKGNLLLSVLFFLFHNVSLTAWFSILVLIRRLYLFICWKEYRRFREEWRSGFKCLFLGKIDNVLERKSIFNSKSYTRQHFNASNIMCVLQTAAWQIGSLVFTIVYFLYFFLTQILRSVTF